MDSKELIEKLEAVTSRKDLAEFVECLRENLLDHPEQWESVALSDFLDALASVIIDMQFMYINRGLVIPEKPSWLLVAEMLYSASGYE